MADADRAAQLAPDYLNTIHYNHESSLHNSGSETRIQIEENASQQRLNQPARGSEHHPLPDRAAAVQQNITSILNQARSEFERRTQQTRQWGVNWNAVLQGIRQPQLLVQEPTIQQAENGGRNLETSQASEESESRVHILFGTNGNNPPAESSSAFINLNGSEAHAQSPALVGQGINSSGTNAASLENAPNRISNSEQTQDAVNGSREQSSQNNRVGRSRMEASNPTGTARRLPPDESALSEMLAQVPELRQFIIIVVRYIPFVLILLTKLFLDNFKAVSSFISVLSAFVWADASLQKQIARRGQSYRLIFVRDIFVIISFVLYKVTDKLEYHNLWLVRNIEEPYSWESLLYTVWITDHLLKIITVLCKNFIALLPIRIIHYSRKGRFYMLIESVSQLYRYIAPIRPWLTYLTEAYSPVIKVVSGFLYMTPKLLYLMSHVEFFKKAVKMFPNKVKYGSIPSKKDIGKVGDQCPICHDRFDAPVLLECNHIFCEGCIATWFRNESTCPMCRAKVVDDMSWLDGRTTQFIQLF